MTVYEDGNYRIELDRKGRVYHKNHLLFIGDTHLAISMFSRLELFLKEEAKHKNIFVAGWRPFIGWTCGIALCWHFVLAPVTIFVCAYLAIVIPELPTFDMGSLMTVLMGMLGLGTLRTYEKQKGLTK